MPERELQQIGIRPQVTFEQIVDGELFADRYRRFRALGKRERQ